MNAPIQFIRHLAMLSPALSSTDSTHIHTHHIKVLKQTEDENDHNGNPS